MQDIHESCSVATLIGNATLAADNTPAAVDLAGFQQAEVVLAIGVGGITFSGTNKIEFVLTHSHDDTTYVNVTDSDVVGAATISNGIIKALTAAHAAAATYRFGYVGPRRYLKLLADFSGTHGSGTPIAAVVLRGNAAHKPAPNQN
jgi:hypothetical protein